MLLARPIVCRIFYSIRVAAFLPPRTFLRRRQYSFEPLQQPEESVYNIVRVYVCILREKERGGNLGRLEIQFKKDRVLVVRTFSLSEFSTKAIETTETEINRERERA